MTQKARFTHLCECCACVGLLLLLRALPSCLHACASHDMVLRPLVVLGAALCVIVCVQGICSLSL